MFKRKPVKPDVAPFLRGGRLLPFLPTEAEATRIRRIAEIEAADCNNGNVVRAMRSYDRLMLGVAATCNRVGPDGCFVPPPPGIEGWAMVLTGPSAVGKSNVLKNIVQDPRLAFRTVEGFPWMPILALTAPSPSTIKTLGSKMLETMGAEPAGEREPEHYILHRVRKALVALGVVLANRIGLGRGALANCKDAAIVADALAEPVEGVAFDSGHWSASAVRLRGEVLSRRHWSGSTPVRFCPSCLAGDAEAAPGHRHAAWLRTWWDVTALAVCPVHLSPLADACGCGAAVPRQQPFGGRCPSCDAHLADTPTPAPFGAASVRGQLYVLGRLGATAPITCPVLDRAPLRDVIQGLGAVGQDLALEGAFHLPMDRGFTAFEDWPRSFDLMLDRLSSDTDGRKGRWGAVRAYGALHDFVRRATGDCLAVDLAKRTAAHADRKGISPGRTLYGVKCGGGGVASLAEVSRLTGLSYKKSRRLAARLMPGAPTGSGAPLSVDAEAAAELARAYPGSVSLKPLSSLLGMKRKAVGDLVKAGVLVPVVDGGGTNRHHAFRPEDADRLVASLGAALDAFGGEVVSLPDACHRMQVPTADAIGLVLRGGVRGRLLPDARGIKCQIALKADPFSRGMLAPVG